MSALWPHHHHHHHPPDGARDVTHVLMSPRANPMSRRSLSQKRMQEPSAYLLFKFLKGSDPSADDAPARDGNPDVDSAKLHRKQDYLNSRFGDSDTAPSKSNPSGVPHFTRKNWRQSAFYASTLLVITFFLLKVIFLGRFSLHDQASNGSQVMLSTTSILGRSTTLDGVCFWC